jgi:hypothetical protein
MVSGYWFLVSGNWSLGSGCWVLVARCWMLDAGYSKKRTEVFEFGILIAFYPFFIACSYYRLPLYLPLTGARQPYWISDFNKENVLFYTLSLAL